MKILFIYPHPDDETFFNPALMQRLNKAKIEYGVICLTKGEASTLNHKKVPEKTLSEVREHEFNEVMTFLKVPYFKIFNFGDGKIEKNSQEVENFLKDQIKILNPEFVVTFEPSGVYGHPDHIETTKICEKLFSNLIYATVKEGHKPSEKDLKMAHDASKVIPLVPNFTFNLSAKEYLTKLRALFMYNSQVNLKYDTRHLLGLIWMMRKEYYFARSSDCLDFLRVLGS